LALVLGAATFWVGWGESEPVYGNRTLSQWLYPGDPDFIWLPTDVYGHIHDELWETLVSPPASTGAGASASESDLQSLRRSFVRSQSPALGPEAIPWLIRWMAQRPTVLDHLLTSLRPHAPGVLQGWLMRFDDSPWTGRAGRWQIAAQEGFLALGVRASNAVPHLAPLMERDDAELPLALALTSLGPSGVAVVVKALEGSDPRVRDTAALALGMGESREAIPALIRCVERGESSYAVLGAIGRIDAKQPAVIGPLIRQLEAWQTDRGTNLVGISLKQSMAVLLLGLQGTAASNAAPVLVRLHQTTQESANGSEADRRLLRRVLRSVSPAAERNLPAPGPRENDDAWP
jgi:hypothetical protein